MNKKQGLVPAGIPLTKGGLGVVWVVLILAVLLGGGYVAVKKLNVESVKEEPKEKNAQVTAPADWKTYRNEEYGFEIKYPPQWESQSTLRGALFRPIGMKQDWQWGIESFKESEKNIEQILNEIRRGEIDRLGESEITVVDYHGDEFMPFTLVVVTNDEIAKSVPTWERHIILLTHTERVYSISNGAIKSDEFDGFYRSLKFTK